MKRHKLPQTARFWIVWNGNLVRLSVKIGTTVNIGSSQPTSEGWKRYSESYSFDGRTVERSYLAEGLDCDGRYSSGGESSCSFADLTAYQPTPHYENGDDFYSGIMMPLWKTADQYERDYAAESAGY